MKRILAATDFSKVSLNAVTYAADMAVEIKAELTLIHVVEVPITLLEEPLTGTEFEEIEKNAKEQLDYLEQKLLLRTNSMIIIHKEIKYGFAEVAIENFCKENIFLVLVIGLKSTPSIEKFLLGTTAMGIVQNIYCPVLIIPKNISFNGIKKIAIASDLKETKETSFIQPIDWLNSFNASIDILYVDTKNEANAYDIDFKSFVKNNFKGFNTTFHLIYNNNIEAGIYDFIEENRSDLLVVIPGRYSFLEKLFRTSHSKQIILNAHLPVLSIPAQQSPLLKKIKEKDENGVCIGCKGVCCENKKDEQPTIIEKHASI